MRGTETPTAPQSYTRGQSVIEFIGHVTCTVQCAALALAALAPNSHQHATYTNKQAPFMFPAHSHTHAYTTYCMYVSAHTHTYVHTHATHNRICTSPVRTHLRLYRIQ